MLVVMSPLRGFFVVGDAFGYDPAAPLGLAYWQPKHMISNKNYKARCKLL